MLAVLLPEVTLEEAYVTVEVLVFTRVVGGHAAGVFLRVIKRESFFCHYKLLYIAVAYLIEDDWGW